MDHPLQQGQFFLLNKPLGWTSFDVVNRMKGFIKHQLSLPKLKIGHAGTLDPLATGLLIICTGRFTKKISSFQDLDKEYTGTFYLGKSTPSYDLEKEPDTDYPTSHLTTALLQSATSQFLGKIDQVPPVFSAIKQDGKRLYEYARKDVAVKPLPRQVTIHSFELTNIDLPRVAFRIACEKGTYIRSLARDYGLAVHSGAYLEELCRTRIGSFYLEQALSPMEWEIEQKKIYEIASE